MHSGCAISTIAARSGHSVCVYFEIVIIAFTRSLLSRRDSPMGIAAQYISRAFGFFIELAMDFLFLLHTHAYLLIIVHYPLE